MSENPIASTTIAIVQNAQGKIPFVQGDTTNEFTENLVRWVVPPPGKLKNLIAYRMSMMSSLASQNYYDANCIQQLSFVGIVGDSMFEEGDADVVKFKYKINCIKKIHLLPKGLEIRSDYLRKLEISTEAKRHIEISVYYIPMSVAYKLGIQVTKRRRSNALSKAEDGNTIPIKKVCDIEKRSAGGVSSKESGVSYHSKCLPMNPKQSIEDGQTTRNERFMKNTSLNENLSINAVNSSRESNMLINVSNANAHLVQHNEAILSSHTSNLMKMLSLRISSDEELLPFNPAMMVSIARLKFNAGFWTRWSESHPCMKISKLEDARGVNIIVDDIVGINLESRGTVFFTVHSIYSDKSMHQIILQVVKFHKNVKNMHKLFLNCIKKWVSVLEKKEKDKLARKKRKSQLENMAKPSVTPISRSHCSEESPYMFSSSGEEDNCATGPSGEKGFSTLESNLQASGEVKQQIKVEKMLKSKTKLNSSVPHAAILCGISQILKISGLSQMLGTNRNLKGFLKYIKRYVFLGGRHCELPLKYLMDSLSIEKVNWIPELLDPKFKWYLLGKVALWLFTRYVCVILRSTFYVTETSSGRNQLGFYKRSSWISVTESLKEKYKTLGNLQQVPGAKELTGRLRFMPKKTGGLRPICSFTKEYKSKLGFKKDVIMLLKYISDEVAPHANTDSASFHLQWKKFLGRWNSIGRPKLYYLRTDIANAYPSVSLKLLRMILARAIPDVKGLYRQSYKQKTKMARGERCSFKDFITKTPRDIPSFIKDRPWCNYVLKGTKSHDAKGAMQVILNSLSPLTVQIGRKRYSFRQGLFQGSKVSQFLCNIYYGYLEQKYFGNFLQSRENELLYRVVDDYLFVSCDKTRVQSFHETMLAAKIDGENSQHMFEINVEKTVHNLKACKDKESVVSFWGWRLNLSSGHISRDYSSYEGTDICVTISTFMAPKDVGKELEFIAKRMKLLTPLRIEAAIMDPEINCSRQIWRNVMDIGSMAAFRFYAMVRILISNPVYMKKEDVNNELFFALCKFVTAAARSCVKLKHRCIPVGECSPVYTCEESESTPLPHSKFVRVVLAKVSHVQDEDSKPCFAKSKLDINSKEFKECKLVLWYGILQKLFKHSSTFSQSLIPRLKARIKILVQHIGLSKAREIFDCIEPKLPAWFERMKK